MLRGTDLRKSFVLERDVFGRARRTMTVVDGVSLEVRPGETVGVVGESGCGKSTTAELLVLLQQPDAGTVELDGEVLSGAEPARLRRARRHLQIVFQDPYSSLDPTQAVGSALAEPLRAHRIGDRAAQRDRVRAILERVGLPSDDQMLQRYPAEFSGGQRQRLAIARALVVEPRYVVLDEAVSALDVSTQAQILQLLRDLQRDLGLGYVFISHDLGVVRHVADVVVVMYLGRIVERGPVRDLFRRPAHPYTAALLRSVPVTDPAKQRRRRATILAGEPPDPAHRPAGCSFHPRCPHARPVCAQEPVTLREVDGRWVACHRAEEIAVSVATSASVAPEPSPVA
jgi:oligopeptide/dipeptide ABC transporter ATP-binding protein